MENFFIFTWLRRSKWFLIWILDYFLHLQHLIKHLLFLIQHRLPLKVKIIKYSYLNKYYNSKVLSQSRKEKIQKLFSEIKLVKKQENLSFYESILLFRHYYLERNLNYFSWKKVTKTFSNIIFFYIYHPLSFLYYGIWHSFCIIIIYPLWDLFLKLIFLFCYLFIFLPFIYIYGVFFSIFQYFGATKTVLLENIFKINKISLRLLKAFKLYSKNLTYTILRHILTIFKKIVNISYKLINTILNSIIGFICMNLFKDYYLVWSFLKKNFENKLNSLPPLEPEELRFKKSELKLPFWYTLALKWFMYKNYTYYAIRAKGVFLLYKYLFILGKDKNDQWFSLKKLYYFLILKVKNFLKKFFELSFVFSFTNLSTLLYKLISYVVFPKNISKIMFFELLLKCCLILPWIKFFIYPYFFYHEAVYTYLTVGEGTSAMYPSPMNDILHWLTWQGENEEQAYLELAAQSEDIQIDYLKLWSCDELLYRTDPYLPFTWVTQVFFLTLNTLIFFSRFWRTLFLPFLPKIFVNKNIFLAEDPFDRLQEIKNQIFKTNYEINLKLKSFLDNSTIDLTTITLKEFIKKRFSFSQLWDIHNELHTYVLEGRLELKNNIYYQNFFREYDLAISKYDNSWLDRIHLKYDESINKVLCEYDYVERAFLNVNRLLLQTTVSNVSSIKNRSRKHLRPFFLDSLLKYEDDKVFFEKIYKDDLQYTLNKFRYKNQYLIKEITQRYYSNYKEYLPFTFSNIGDWVWNLPLNKLRTKLLFNNAQTSYIHQSMKEHIFLDDENVELNTFITHYDNWAEAYDEEMDPDGEWYNTFVDPNIPTAMSEELDELELPSPAEYDTLMKDMFWKNFNIFSLFSNFKVYLENKYGYTLVKDHFQNNSDLNWLTNRQIEFLNFYYKTTDYYKNLPNDFRWQKERKTRLDNLSNLFAVANKNVSYKEFSLSDWKAFNNFNFWLGDSLITKKVLFRPEPHKNLTRFGIEEVNILAIWIAFFVVPYIFFWKNGMWYLLAHSYVDMIWYWWDETYLYSKYVYDANIGGLIEETNDDSFERFYPFWNFPVENRIHNDMIHKDSPLLHDTISYYWSMISNWISCWYVYLQVLAEKRIMYHLFELEENNRKVIFEGYKFIAEKGPALDVPHLHEKRPFMWSWNRGIYDKYIEYYETEAYDLLFINVFKHMLVEIKQYIKYIRALWAYKLQLFTTDINYFVSYYLGDNFIYNFYSKLKYAYELRYYRYLTDNTYRYCSKKWWLFPAKDFTNNMEEVKNNFWFRLFQYDPVQLNEKRIVWKLKPTYSTEYLEGLPRNEVKQYEYLLNGFYVLLWWSIIIIPYIYWLVFSDWVQTNRYRYIIKRFVPNPNDHWMLYMDDLWIDYNEWDLANSATYDPYAFLALERNGELRSFLDLNPYLGSRYHYSWHPLRLLRSDLANKAINNIEEKLNFLNSLDSFLKSEKALYSNLLLNKSVLKRNLNEYEKEYDEQISLLNPSLVDYKCFDDYYKVSSDINQQYIKDVAWKQRLYRLKLYLYKKELSKNK